MTKRDLWAIWDPVKAVEQLRTETPLMESCETVANWKLKESGIQFIKRLEYRVIDLPPINQTIFFEEF